MLVLFGTETPIPTPTMTVEPESVTPGPAGFIVIVVVVIAVVLLIWDMNRRIRRVRYREEVREELDAEEAAGRDTQAPDAGSAEDSGQDGAAPGTNGDAASEKDDPGR
ncbi:hypothetical protein [Microbacterium murale]|uniref:Uncharacterized protein n=1 Tax=Microbacterium murale TaxID=1081040 RepID=A0ABU0PE09_9MICO|nr:hypothetical protein [Microbacterium murale]MDQ0644874.1 hypothetical protein [Microbacterium murale]